MARLEGKRAVARKRRLSTAPLVADDYASLMEALRQRAQNLKLTYLDLEVDAGLPDGYARKIFDLHNHMTPPVFGRLLRALSVRLIVEPVAATPKDSRPPAALAPLEGMDKKSLRKLWSSWGGKKRALKLSRKRRSEIAAIGAHERWRSRREPSTGV